MTRMKYVGVLACKYNVNVAH